MKLTHYIVYESSASAAQKGKKTVEMIMGRLWNGLEKKDFNLSITELITLLNRVSPNNMSFTLKKEPGSVKRYISWGIFDWNDNTLRFEIRDDTNEYFRRFVKDQKKDHFFDVKKNVFYRELQEILTHEIAHQLQFSKGGLDTFIDKSGESHGEYLSRKWEIDAFAVQAAMEIIHGDRSKTWDMYLGHKTKGTITDKIYNRFMKKVYSNIKELQKLGMTK